MQEAQLDEQKR
jgi:hypothetical protein